MIVLKEIFIYDKIFLAREVKWCSKKDLHICKGYCLRKTLFGKYMMINEENKKEKISLKQISTVTLF